LIQSEPTKNATGCVLICCHWWRKELKNPSMTRSLLKDVESVGDGMLGTSPEKQKKKVPSEL